MDPTTSAGRKYVTDLWRAYSFCRAVQLFMFSRAPKVPWEAMYLPAVEAIIYTMSFTGNGYVRMIDGRIMPWSRMASWLVCCPVMLGQISAITLIKYKSIPLNPMMIACSIIRTVMGVSAGVVQEDHLKWVFFWLGCFFFMFELLGCYLIFAIAIADFEACRTDLANRVIGRIKTMRAIIFVCWTSIVVTWVLSSSGACLVDDNYTTMAYVILDAVCKNMYGVVIWSTTWGLLNGKWDREYARTFGQEEKGLEEAMDFDSKGGATGTNDNVEVKMFGRTIGSVRRARRNQTRDMGGDRRDREHWDSRADSRAPSDESRGQQHVGRGEARRGDRSPSRSRSPDDRDKHERRKEQKIAELERTLMEMRQGSDDGGRRR